MSSNTPECKAAKQSLRAAKKMPCTLANPELNIHVKLLCVNLIFCENRMVKQHIEIRTYILQHTVL